MASSLFVSGVHAQSAMTKLTFPGAGILPTLSEFQCLGGGSRIISVNARPVCPSPVFPSVQFLAENVLPLLPFVAFGNRFALFVPKPEIFREIPNNFMNLGGPLPVKNKVAPAPEPHYRHDETVRKPLETRPALGPEFWSLWGTAAALLVTDVEMDARCWNVPGCVKGMPRKYGYSINLAAFALAFYGSETWKRNKYGETSRWKILPGLVIATHSSLIGLRAAHVGFR
ncbi:MAG: hypothetical protein WA734_15795 [Candidatus Acidiferrales bacterium]